METTPRWLGKCAWFTEPTIKRADSCGAVVPVTAWRGSFASRKRLPALHIIESQPSENSKKHRLKNRFSSAVSNGLSR